MNKDSKNLTKSKPTPSEQNVKSKPKRPLPVVRHTKASIARMLKANPLLKYDKASLPPMPKGFKLNNYEPQISFSELKKSVQPGVGKTSNLPSKAKKSLFPNKTIDEKRSRQPLVELEQKIDKKQVVANEKSVPDNQNGRKDVFKTPSAYARRSIAHSASITNSRKSVHLKPQSVSKNDLQRRLSEWLEKRGKSLSSFHHIKCFGVMCSKSKPAAKQLFEKSIDDENKENVELEIPEKGSYEDLRIKSDEEEPVPAEQIENVAKSALNDLHKLILEGYPLDQCESWLKLIQEKGSKALDDEYEYWECRADIEKMRGDLTKAVDCYQKAIVKGAEIKTIDESLDQLLQKFSLLHIDPADKNVSDKERERVCREARNIFKSSIIKFAVQEKKIKKHEECDKKFILTPVRRSTRRSRSVCITPARIVESIDELEIDFRQNVEFKRNVALK